MGYSRITDISVVVYVDGVWDARVVNHFYYLTCTFEVSYEYSVDGNDAIADQDATDAMAATSATDDADYNVNVDDHEAVGAVMILTLMFSIGDMDANDDIDVTEVTVGTDAIAGIVLWQWYCPQGFVCVGTGVNQDTNVTGVCHVVGAYCVFSVHDVVDVDDVTEALLLVLF